MLNEFIITFVLVFIDFYRSKYAFIKNVKNIIIDNEKYNVLTQMICCLIDIKYQIRIFCLDAWNFGYSQRRNKIIIIIATSNLTLLSKFLYIYSYYERVSVALLKKTTNNFYTGSRIIGRTLFEYVTLTKIIKDLFTTNARTIYISFLDYRINRILSVTN